MEEAHFRLLRLIEANPELTQRQLAQEMGVSLGKVNYCINALIERGWVKARNFRKADNKLSYAYLLTPSGAKQKAASTIRFLNRKIGEYEALRKEIAELKREVTVGVAAVPAARLKRYGPEGVIDGPRSGT